MSFEEGNANCCPTIDRKNPDMGYSDENCQLVVSAYSAAKGDGNHEDVLALAQALVMRSKPALGVAA